MTDYRVVKKPAALASFALSVDEGAVVEAGGNEAAIGTDIADGEHAGQLDIWYRDGRTLVVGRLDGQSVDAWSFKGSVSPEDCRTAYLAKIAR